MTRTRRNLGAVAILLFVAGCKSTSPHGGGRNDDPLLGANVPIQASPQAIYQPPPTGSPNYPPLTTATPTSTAALASGAYPPLVGSQDLRIGTPSSGGWKID